MSKTLEFFERKLLSQVPKGFIELTKEYPLFIAGGAITSIFTNQEINDLDVYIKRDVDIFALGFELVGMSTILSVTNKSIFLELDGIKINVILLDSYATAEDIFDSFDFTCVMGAYDFESKKFIFHDDFMIHNAQRIIHFHAGTRFPIMSLIRVHKYEEKGYKISKTEVLRIIMTCMQLNINSYEELEDHIGGLYGIDLSELLDTEKEFDLNRIVEELADVMGNYDELSVKKQVLFESQADLKHKFYDHLIKIGTKYKESKISKTTFYDFKYADKPDQIDYLVINNRLFEMPDCFENADLPVQTVNILVYIPLKEVDGRYTDNKDINVAVAGDIATVKNASQYTYRAFRVYPYNLINKYHANEGEKFCIFKINSAFCTKFHNYGGDLMFDKLEFVGVSDIVAHDNEVFDFALDDELPF